MKLAFHKFTTFLSFAPKARKSLKLDHLIPLSEELYSQALELFRNRPDKELGLVDCVSIIVMQERGLTEALTTDEHFKQAGFRALLRDE